MAISKFIARQAAKPHGLFGRLLNRANAMRQPISVSVATFNELLVILSYINKNELVGSNTRKWLSNT